MIAKRPLATHNSHSSPSPPRAGHAPFLPLIGGFVFATFRMRVEVRVHRREAHARRLAISHTGRSAVEPNSRLRDRSGVGAGLRLILSAAACVMLFTTIAAAATLADCSAP